MLGLDAVNSSLGDLTLSASQISAVVSGNTDDIEEISETLAGHTQDISGLKTASANLDVKIDLLDESVDSRLDTLLSMSGVVKLRGIYTGTAGSTEELKLKEAVRTIYVNQGLDIEKGDIILVRRDETVMDEYIAKESVQNSDLSSSSSRGFGAAWERVGTLSLSQINSDFVDNNELSQAINDANARTDGLIDDISGTIDRNFYSKVHMNGEIEQIYEDLELKSDAAQKKTDLLSALEDTRNSLSTTIDGKFATQDTADSIIQTISETSSFLQTDCSMLKIKGTYSSYEALVAAWDGQDMKAGWAFIVNNSGLQPSNFSNSDRDLSFKNVAIDLYIAEYDTTLVAELKLASPATYKSFIDNYVTEQHLTTHLNEATASVINLVNDNFVKKTEMQQYQDSIRWAEMTVAKNTIGANEFDIDDPLVVQTHVNAFDGIPAIDESSSPNLIVFNVADGTSTASIVLPQLYSSRSQEINVWITIENSSTSTKTYNIASINDNYSASRKVIFLKDMFSRHVHNLNTTFDDKYGSSSSSVETRRIDADTGVDSYSWNVVSGNTGKKFITFMFKCKLFYSTCFYTLESVHLSNTKLISAT